MNHDDHIQNLITQVLEQQSISVAYRRGVAAARRLKVGDHLGELKQEAVKAGYPTHTQENHLFVEGVVDSLQDNGIVISTDEHEKIVALHGGDRLETIN